MTEDLQTSTNGVEEIQEAAVVDEAEIEIRKADLAQLIEVIRPSVKLDGGDLHVVSADYVTGVVEIMLDGACGTCAISSMTLEGGVDRLIKENLSWVTEVTGDVDQDVDKLASAAQGRGAYVPRYY